MDGRTTSPTDPPATRDAVRKQAAGCAWWWWVIILIAILVVLWLAWGMWRPGGSHPNVPGPGPTTPPSPVHPGVPGESPPGTVPAPGEGPPPAPR